MRFGQGYRLGVSNGIGQYRKAAVEGTAMFMFQ